MDLPHLPQYRILERVASGANADVYRAVDVRLGRTVALKILRADLARDPTYAGRLMQEITAVVRLHHPNIVPVVDAGVDEGLRYLVMPWIEGKSLEQVLAREPGKPLPLQYAIEIIRQIADALAHAHEVGVVHRDVKPSNIMIADDGRVLLSDFGIAAYKRGPGTTLAGTILGTPHYMAPEQARGEAADPASDQYSVAVVAYQLLTGQLPFEGSTTEILLAHVSQVPRPLRQLNLAIPSNVERVVLKALSKKPDQRFPSVQTFAQSLSLAAGLPPLEQLFVSRRGQARKWLWLALFIPLALTALTFVLARSGYKIGFLEQLRERLPGGPLVPLVLLVLLSALMVALLGRMLARVPPPRPTLPRRSSRRTPITGEFLPVGRAEREMTAVLRRSPEVAAFLLVLSGSQRGQQLRLDRPQTTLGRTGGQADIQLDSPMLSRIHASIRLENGEFVLRDEQSTNGTWLNGARLLHPEVLHDRDEVQIGTVNMVFMHLAASAPPEAVRRVREFESVWDELTQAVERG